MAPKAVRLQGLQERISALALEESSSRGLARRKAWLQRWALMLYREYLRDDIKVRAESLAYLMIFSILPIIAGCFFLFTIFAQFGMVQEAISGLVDRLMQNIPAEHRGFIQDYTLKFKDAYLSSIAGKSGKMGIFALGVLFWVGLQTFNNIDRALNHIWASERDRPFFEQIRNFIVLTVAGPVVIISSLSVPLILKQVAVAQSVFDSVPILWRFLNFLVTSGLIVGTFTFLYRYVPVTHVRWKSAISGAVFSALLLQIANALLNVYFRIGTNSAYGKAAIVPLLGFWIYVMWMIIILGAELSYLHQNEKYYIAQRAHSPTWIELEALLAVGAELVTAHFEGRNPVSFAELHTIARLDVTTLRSILNFFEDKGIALRVISEGESESDDTYALARDVNQDRVADILGEYTLKSRPEISSSPWRQAFDASLQAWLASFGDSRLDRGPT